METRDYILLQFYYLLQVWQKYSWNLSLNQLNFKCIGAMYFGIET